MKTALVGNSGYIAEYILKRFADESNIESVLKIGRNTESDVYLDLQKAEKFDYSQLDDIDYIVFTAAVSSPDKCAEEFESCWSVNVTGTCFFIREAINRGCKVLFFSSDAVFGDIPGAIYTEESETQAVTSYGRMKKAVEDEFKRDFLFKAIRLSYVASAKDRFAAYCLYCIKNNKAADIFHPFYRNVIVVSDVVDIVLYFAYHWNDYTPTFLNAAGKELVSRIRIADELNRYFDGALKYKVTMPQEDFFINRPRITQMQSLYMQRYGIIQDSSFTEKIAKELERIEI